MESADPDALRRLDMLITRWAIDAALDHSYDSVILSPLTIGYFSAYIVVGSVLLGIDLHRRERFVSTLRPPSTRVMPFATPSRGGASFGFAVRF